MAWLFLNIIAKVGLTIITKSGRILSILKMFVLFGATMLKQKFIRN